MATLMKCGHSANATQRPDNTPCCVICGCNEVENDKPDLSGRTAWCTYCGKSRESNYGLPFFRHQPTHKVDSYYCGCRGWD
jgi:hypothetical protein